MFKKSFFLFVCCLCCALWAEQSFIETHIRNKPKGIVRDFYIWQYLHKHNPSAHELQNLYDLLSATNPYLRRAIAHLSKTTALPRDVQCANMELKSALQTDTTCFERALKGKFASARSFNTKEQQRALNLTKDSTLKAALQVLFAKNRLQLLAKSDAAVFARVYPALNGSEKQKIPLTSQILQTLSAQKNNAFYQLLHSVAMSKNSPLKPLLLQSDIATAPHGTLFTFGLNELRFGSKQKAMVYFARAQAATSSAFFVDRALFWQYLVSKDSRYLHELLKSKHVNLFSLYAAEILGQKPAFSIRYDVANLSSAAPPFNPSDPYQWQEIASAIAVADNARLSEMIPYFSFESTLPHLVYLLDRIEKFQHHYFIVPYDGLIAWESVAQKSLTLAIAKQESLFLPALISRSFALGLMQIMPANIEPFAKEMGLKNVQYDSLFEPAVALQMGRFYLNKLEREYRHPLFVAYAYNGGPTFLRKLLAKGELFRKNAAFEPWLSMELIPYEETRFYGMRVLANYLVYQQHFGQKTSLRNLLNESLVY